MCHSDAAVSVEPNGNGESTKALVRQAIAASEANAARIDKLDHKLDFMAGDLARLKLEDARRVGFYAGAKAGAQFTLLAIAAALGSGATTLLDYLAGR